MDTICIKLNYVSGRTDLPRLYEETIRIGNTPGNTCAWFYLNVEAPIELSFSQALQVGLAGGKNVDAASVNTHEVSTLSLSTAGGYSIFIDEMMPSGTTLTFSDIRQVTEFDCTNVYPQNRTDINKWKGLAISVESLPKLALLRNLYCRYGLTGIYAPCVLDLRTFSNLQQLYIGTDDPGPRFIYKLYLAEEAYGRLTTINVAVHYITPNILKLTHCTSFYLQGTPSWQELANIGQENMDFSEVVWSYLDLCAASPLVDIEIILRLLAANTSALSTTQTNIVIRLSADELIPVINSNAMMKQNATTVIQHCHSLKLNGDKLLLGAQQNITKQISENLIS